MLEVTDLNLKINGKTVVYDLSFSVKNKERLGIVGESGSGKSMTALSIMGLLPKKVQKTGVITYENLPIYRRLYGNQISMVFQDPMNSLNPLMKLGRQINENARTNLELSKAELEKLTIKTMHDVGFVEPEKLIHAYPYELSGGMRQRAMIASAIICSPRLLIVDEPTTALDRSISNRIVDLLIDISNKNNMSMIFISHDISIVSKVCDSLLVMKGGKMVEYGATTDIINSPQKEYTKHLINNVITPEKKDKL